MGVSRVRLSRDARRDGAAEEGGHFHHNGTARSTRKLAQGRLYNGTQR